jgi:hypothetical protein
VSARTKPAGERCEKIEPFVLLRVAALPCSLKSMIKVFYIGDSASTTGMLRAVLSEGWQAAELSRSQEFIYVGSDFPSLRADQTPATIIEISGKLDTLSLATGFYRAEHPPLGFEETLRALHS